MKIDPRTTLDETEQLDCVKLLGVLFQANLQIDYLTVHVLQKVGADVSFKL